VPPENNVRSFQPTRNSTGQNCIYQHSRQVSRILFNQRVPFPFLRLAGDQSKSNSKRIQFGRSAIDLRICQGIPATSTSIIIWLSASSLAIQRVA
jgi:hypothetical protein